MPSPCGPLIRVWSIRYGKTWVGQVFHFFPVSVGEEADPCCQTTLRDKVWFFDAALETLM